MNINFVLLCVSFLLLSCSSAKSDLYYKEKMNEEWGKDVQWLQSPEGTYTLFYNKDTIADGQVAVKLLVVENKTDEPIFQDTLPNATLSWYSDTHLLVEQRLGILQKDASANGTRRFLLNPANGRKNSLPQNPNVH